MNKNRDNPQAPLFPQEQQQDTLIFDSYCEYFTYCLRTMSKVNGVSKEFAEKHPDYKEDNSTNKGCWNCLNCRNCAGCTQCVSCSFCLYCIDCIRCIKSRYCISCSELSKCYDCSGQSNLSEVRGKEASYDYQ